jgi:hypothetical protein
MQSPEQFDQFALVELMGRQRIAGRVTEKTIAGAGFLQVDVPETASNPAFTRLIAPGSLYAINPVTEEVARMYAENLNVKPIEAWDIREFMKKAEEKRLELQTAADHEVSDPMGEEDDDDDEPDHYDNNN